MARPPTAQTRAKPISQATQRLLDEMEADRPVASSDQLDVIRAKAAELRGLEKERQDIEERLSRISERRKTITDKELVDLMDGAGVPSITLAAEGNLPEFTVAVGPYYHANIADDWPDEKRAKAFAWISRYHGGMLRNTVTISFGKGSQKQQKALEGFLKKQKIAFSNKFGVPWNTLTAFVKEQIEEHRKTPPLALLGATVGRVAKIKKEKK
jgi:hypothetical protein